MLTVSSCDEMLCFNQHKTFYAMTSKRQQIIKSTFPKKEEEQISQLSNVWEIYQEGYVSLGDLTGFNSLKG